MTPAKCSSSDKYVYKSLRARVQLPSPLTAAAQMKEAYAEFDSFQAEGYNTFSHKGLKRSCSVWWCGCAMHLHVNQLWTMRRGASCP